MSGAGIDAYLVTGSDPHGSENPPSSWRTREWISGFTGSAGTVVVTSSTAGLWTDFRYWIQAPLELEESGISLFRENAEGVPLLEDWLADNLPKGALVGVDGRTIPAGRARDIEIRLGKAGIELSAGMSPWDELWELRPSLPDFPAVELGADESGESRTERLTRLRQALKAAGADTWIGTALDSVAWLLNVRGGDIPNNPVITGYIIVKETEVSWFVDETKLPLSLKDSLAEDLVTVVPYDDFYPQLAALNSSARILLDPDMLSRSVRDGLPEGISIIEGDDPVVLMKAVKNQVEAAQTCRAMEKDGVAIVRFVRELGIRLEDGEHFTEIEAAQLLLEKREAIPGFLDESFSPIPAVGGHGAICHYEAKEEGVGILEKGSGVFLIDSGGQWEEGTTDITRTLSLGSTTDEQKKDYTLVLQGHVALSMARFPRGTRGYQLDTLARMFLWQEGRDFGHGTGHGVGYRLNVHEGPQRISTHPIDVAIIPGMIVSNEPGVYREDRYGIRIENLLICREDTRNEFGTFLVFDTLTLAPYDRRLIETSMLNDIEISWIDTYHAEVFKRLSPMLETPEAEWLAQETAALER